MDASTKQSLVKAIQLLKAGDRSAAVPLLAGVLKKEPRLVQAWYLLGLAVDSRQKKIRAFEQALALDPFHEKARTQLDALQAVPSEQASIGEPEPEVPEPVEETIKEQTSVMEEVEAEPGPEAPSPTETEPLESLRAGYTEEAESPVGESPAEGAADKPTPFEDSLPPIPTEPSPFIDPASPDNPDFDLPDWMDESTFDPSDYQAAPAEAGQIYENAPEEIPEWAQMNPWEPEAASNQGEPELESEQPGWAQPASEQAVEESTPEEGVEKPAWASEPGDDSAASPDQYELSRSEAERLEAILPAEEEEPAVEAEETEEPEEPDWLRGIVEEEEGKDKKKKKKQKKTVTHSQKKRRRRIILNLVLLFVCIGAGVSGYIFREELKPYTDRVWHPILTQAEPITDLLTQDAPLTYLLTPDFNVTPSVTPTVPQQPTAEPTWTPQSTSQAPSDTPPPTLAPGETPTATPTLAPLPAEILSQMAQIESKVMLIRGHGGPQDFDREFTSNPRLKDSMRILLVDENVQENLEDQEIVLQALGFINGSYNLTDAYLNSQADAIGGFYYPESDRVFIIGSISDGFSAIEQYVYAHEFTQAVLDRQFGLDSLGYYPTCTVPTQECQAIQAVVKGDAALTQQIWFEEDPPEVGYQDILYYSPSNTLFSASTPAYFSQGTVFESEHGLAFVTYLYDNGGWQAVDRAYSFPPTTTEQILHPEKFLQQEGAGGLTPPGYADLRSQEWELIEQDSLGEWNTFLLLAHNDYTIARRPEDEAAMAAAGWSADDYQVYYNPEQQQVFLSVYWSWDTVEDANQFYASLTDSLSRRFGNASIDSPGGGECWFYRSQKSCIQKDGTKVYWLLSEDTEMLDLVRERFKLFP